MKAIVLLSGGLDSTVILAIALNANRNCHAISFDYGQRHRVELKAAHAVAKHYDIAHKVIQIDPQTFAHSAMLSNEPIPKKRTQKEISSEGIPNTYIPARNTLFLAYAIGQAEQFSAEEIFFGANKLDYHPYPDCRPEYFNAFQGVINIATKQAVTNQPPRLVTPLISWDKTQIIQQGLQLNAPLTLTFSCYDPQHDGSPCLSCDACILREEGFRKAKH